MTHPLMPKATAVWLIENTALTFLQISEFCGLHILEIQSIADEEYGSRIKGSNPMISSQLTAEEIKRCELDSAARLKLTAIPSQILKKSKKVTKKYTPLSKRQDKPDAIHFLIKKYPELQDSQICKLVGTTKSTVEAIRAKNHWKMTSMREIDPVISGFCKQSELEEYLKKARVRQDREVELHQKPSHTFSDDNQPLQEIENL